MKPFFQPSYEPPLTKLLQDSIELERLKKARKEIAAILDSIDDKIEQLMEATEIELMIGI